MMHALSPVASISNNSPSFDSDDDLEEHYGLLDPFELDSDDDEMTDDDDLLQNTQGNSGPDRSETLLGARMPANPFHSTLASDSRTIKTSRHRSADETSERPERHYDVESFTRLLMTGQGDSRQEKLLANTARNASSTQSTSSAPLPALPELRPHVRQRVPQSLHNVFLSDEQHGIASMSDRYGENIQIVTPGHYHGKLTSKADQGTTSTQALPTIPSSSTVSPTESTSRSVPTSPQSPINLNKPLPPPPIASGHLTPPSADTAILIDPSIRQSEFSGLGSSNLKPSISLLSRFSNYAGPETLVATSEQPLAGSGNRLGGFQANPHSPPTPSSKPPPPPPPRRHGRARGISVSSTNSAISGASTSLTPSSTDEFSSRPFKEKPLLPPARTPSNSSMNRLTRRSTHPDSPSTAPPSAPPPRRVTIQNNYNTSAHIEDTSQGIDHQHPDPWASLISPPAKAWRAPELSGTDVLAGLSELQREVDELRGKIRG